MIKLTAAARGMKQAQMYCKACGKQIENGSRFCVHCGEKVDNQPASSKSPRLIIILCGAVLIAVIAALLVWLPGSTGLLGKWYDVDGCSGTIEFSADGTFRMQTLGVGISGSYTYDMGRKTGQLLAEGADGGQAIAFTMDDGLLNINEIWYTKVYVKQIDRIDSLEVR